MSENSSVRYHLTDAQQARMLRKLLLYWDGQWFLKAAEAYGLDEAVRLNAQVRASFGRIEMRSLLKAVGKPRADDLADAMHLLETYAGAFMGPALRAEFSTASATQAEVIVRRCAAYEGAKRAGLPRVDQACIACEGLWDVWLETLLPGSGVQVEVAKRQGLGDARCRFVIRLVRSTQKPG